MRPRISRSNSAYVTISASYINDSDDLSMFHKLYVYSELMPKLLQLLFPRLFLSEQAG